MVVSIHAQWVSVFLPLLLYREHMIPHEFVFMWLILTISYSQMEKYKLEMVHF